MKMENSGNSNEDTLALCVARIGTKLPFYMSFASLEFTLSINLQNKHHAIAQYINYILLIMHSLSA